MQRQEAIRVPVDNSLSGESEAVTTTLQILQQVFPPVIQRLIRSLDNYKGAGNAVHMASFFFFSPLRTQARKPPNPQLSTTFSHLQLLQLCTVFNIFDVNMATYETDSSSDIDTHPSPTPTPPPEDGNRCGHCGNNFTGTERPCRCNIND